MPISTHKELIDYVKYKTKQQNGIYYQRKEQIQV